MLKITKTHCNIGFWLTKINFSEIAPVFLCLNPYLSTMAFTLDLEISKHQKKISLNLFIFIFCFYFLCCFHILFSIFFETDKIDMWKQLLTDPEITTIKWVTMDWNLPWNSIVWSLEDSNQITLNKKAYKYSIK